MHLDASCRLLLAYCTQTIDAAKQSENRSDEKTMSSLSVQQDVLNGIGKMTGIGTTELHVPMKKRNTIDLSEFKKPGRSLPKDYCWTPVLMQGWTSPIYLVAGAWLQDTVPLEFLFWSILCRHKYKVWEERIGTRRSRLFWFKWFHCKGSGAHLGCNLNFDIVKFKFDNVKFEFDIVKCQIQIDIWQLSTQGIWHLTTIYARNMTWTRCVMSQLKFHCLWIRLIRTEKLEVLIAMKGAQQSFVKLTSYIYEIPIKSYRFGLCIYFCVSYSVRAVTPWRSAFSTLS